MTCLAHRILAQRTVAETIEHALAIEILRGDRPPDSRLPSVRALAQRWETTVPTIQRALDRLAAKDLIKVRRGSGATVQAPRSGGLSIYPLWFDALAHEPDACASRLSDFLDLRRVVLVHLLTRHHARLLAMAPRMQPHIVALGALDADIADRAAADLALSAGIAAAIDNSAVAAVIETVAQLVWRVPWIAEAFYDDPAAHFAMVTTLASAITAFGPDLAARLTAIIGSWDERVVQRFRALLG